MSVNNENIVPIYLNSEYTQDSCGGHTWGVDAFNSVTSAVTAAYATENAVIHITGGTFDSVAFASTTVVMEGGSVSDLSGSGVISGLVTPSDSYFDLTISGGTVAGIEGVISYNAVGDGSRNTEDNPTIYIKITDDATVTGSIRAAGWYTQVTGDTRIDITGGLLQASGWCNILGAAQSTSTAQYKEVKGDTYINISGGTITGYNGIFGGGWNAATVRGNTNISISGGSISANIYGSSGSSGTVDGTATITISGGTIAKDISVAHNDVTTVNRGVVAISGGTINGNINGAYTVNGSTLKFDNTTAYATSNTTTISNFTNVQFNGGSVTFNKAQNFSASNITIQSSNLALYTVSDGIYTVASGALTFAADQTFTVGTQTGVVNGDVLTIDDKQYTFSATSSGITLRAGSNIYLNSTYTEEACGDHTWGVDATNSIATARTLVHDKNTGNVITINGGSYSSLLFFDGIHGIITDGVFSGIQLMGSYSGGNPFVSSCNTEENPATWLTISGGTFSGVVNGGGEYNKQTGAARLDISGGSFGGSWYYIAAGNRGDGKADTRDVVGNTYLNISGGTFDGGCSGVLGAGWHGAGVQGSTYINISGGEFKNNISIFGAGHNTMATVTGDTNLFISGGTIGGSVYVGGLNRATTDTVLGHGYLTISGGTIAGNIDGTGTVSGSELTFSNAAAYAVGSNSTISGFSAIHFNGAAVSFAKTQNFSGVSLSVTANLAADMLPHVITDGVALTLPESITLNGTAYGVGDTFTQDNVTYQLRLMNNTLFVGLEVANQIFVDASYSASNCGGHIWGYDAFSTTSDVLSNLEDGGTLNITSANSYNSSIELAGKELKIDASGRSVSGSVYGGGNNATVTAGTNLSLIGGTFGVVVGGNQTSDVTGDVITQVQNSTITKAFYGGSYNGGITGSISTTLGAGSEDTLHFVKMVCAGSYQNASTASKNISGNIETAIQGGIFSDALIGGSYAAANSSNDNTHTVGGAITLALQGGTFQKNKSVYTAGYAVGNANTPGSATAATLVVSGEVSLSITNATFSGTAVSGRGIYLGMFSANKAYAVVNNNASMTISGGTMTEVFGGGWAQAGGQAVIHGNVSIQISGGTMDSVYGGGNHATSGGTTQTTGAVTITVSGGTINNIYAAGKYALDTVVNGAKVIFTGTNSFALNTVSGISSNDVDNLAGNAVLSFADYTGSNISITTVKGFDSVQISGSSVVNLATASDLSAVSQWDFDLSSRDAADFDTAMLNWNNGSNDFTGDVIALHLASAQATANSWDLLATATGSSVLDNLASVGSIKLYVDDAQTSIDLAWGGTVAEGSFAGWGLAVSDNTLKFSKIA